MFKASHEMTVLAFWAILLSNSLGVRAAIRLDRVTTAVKMLRMESLFSRINEMISDIRLKGISGWRGRIPRKPYSVNSELDCGGRVEVNKNPPLP